MYRSSARGARRGQRVTSGYAGGHEENPTYEKLLEVFFMIHDPTFDR